MPNNPQIEFHFDFEDSESIKNLEQLRILAEKILIAEEAPSKTLNIILTGDELVRSLNTDYRNKAKTTDVLSFPLEDEEMLGEVYISVEQVERQAPRFDNSFEDELARMFVHGVLHIIGYDHIKPAERKIMRAKEEFYLNRSIY